MADALLRTLRTTLPVEIADALGERLIDLKSGQYEKLLSLPLVKLLVGQVDDDATNKLRYDNTEDWNDYIFRRLNVLLSAQHDGESLEESVCFKQHFFAVVGVAALQTFIQANVTGPTLTFSPASLLLPAPITQDSKQLKALRSRLISSLTVDGIAPNRLASYPELICLADTIFTAPSIRKGVKVADWARIRTAVLHQRLLSETSSTLQDQIYEGWERVWKLVECSSHPADKEVLTELCLERAAVNLLHGSDKKARDDLQRAQQLTGLQYALTGKLGRRTKFQEKETSQLVVLARSREREPASAGSDGANEPVSSSEGGDPKMVNLEDDTLLDRISFSSQSHVSTNVQVVDESRLLPSLASLDVAHQPQLHPIDSTILLLLASAITNTSPVDGLTREETLPYALRVLDGGSSNWQIYTQALLVRSRIEGYRSRTAERGLLQLQALVDQIIADTSSGSSSAQHNDAQPEASTFLPRSASYDSGSASQRLRYVHLLSSPTRWELEGELASRWTQMGGLRSALEIYERLEMWPEAALCWAATEREEKARHIIKRQLCHARAGTGAEVDDELEPWDGEERQPPPPDAPRLWCILADIDNNPALWQKAWTVSGRRYARAQRSLGRWHLAQKEFDAAAEAYAMSLKVNQLNKGSWFAYGCCLLELSRFEDAVEAFARTVQLDDDDAEAWSNLAAALVKRGPRKARNEPLDANGGDVDGNDVDNGEQNKSQPDTQQHLRDALRAFKRAATLKQDSARIYDNVLTAAASLTPPAYSDVVAAQQRIIELRGKAEGEHCVDESIIEELVRHVISNYPSPSHGTDAQTELDATTALSATARPGSIPSLVTGLVHEHIQPLITHSSRLWHAVAQLAIWQHDPLSALEAHEKAWRVVSTSSDLATSGNAAHWDAVVQSTLDLCDAYESLGPQARSADSGAGPRDVVAKDWPFKARSAVRGVLGRGRDSWEGSAGWTRLQARLADLKGA